MYARVIEYQALPHVTLSDAKTMYQRIIATLVAMDGFLGSTFMMNESTHRAVSITWWRDDVCAAHGGRQTFPLLVQISDMMVNPPVISGYDVVDQALDQTVPLPSIAGDGVDAESPGAV